MHQTKPSQIYQLSTKCLAQLNEKIALKGLKPNGFEYNISKILLFS